MNELSLFTGAGGGVLGSKLLGHKLIGYVEYEPYCQEIIKQRISDGILDAAPIFGDIRKFISEGYAESYQGVDLVTGGFPCQPFSQAGKRAGKDDHRNMWPYTIECLRLVRPRYGFFENVPGLLTVGYFDRILADLATCGYDAKWTCLGADDVGANHRRKRIWIFSWDTNRIKHENREIGEIQEGIKVTHSERVCKEMAHSNGCGHLYGESEIEPTERGVNAQQRTVRCCGNVADSDITRLKARTVEELNGKSEGGLEGLESWGKGLQDRGWWKVEPAICRVAHGVAHRVDRLKGTGNGQVPLQMAYAFSILSQGIIDGEK